MRIFTLLCKEEPRSLLDHLELSPDSLEYVPGRHALHTNEFDAPDNIHEQYKYVVSYSL